MACKAKLMIPEDEKYEGKPFALSHARTAITTIKAKFNTQQLQRFEGSCFGHLLLIEDLKWNSQVVHGLLMRKADPKTVTQVNGIKFIVGNKLIQFTAQYFCLITGLRFGKLPFIPKATNENCSLKQKYFNSNKPPILLDLHAAFIECTDGDDALKLGMVYFAIFVLLVSPDYQRVKVPQNKKKPNKRGKKRAQTRMECNRATEYIIRGFGFALQIWAFEVFPALEALHFTVHEDNRHIPRILHWRSNTVARFREVMSQVYENFKVDVQLLRPTNIEKQQPYWSWGDDENNEEIVQLFGGEGEDKTSTSCEEKEADVEETTTLPSSSKGKGSFNDFGRLKHQLESTKDELAKLRSSNRGLRNRVRDLEAIVDKNCLKHEKECDRNKKAIRDLTLTIASVEHYFKLEMEELKKLYGGEGHEEVCTAQMNEGGQNEMSPLNELTSPTTAGPKMDAQVEGDGVEAFPDMHTERAEMEATVYGGVEGAEREAEVPADGVEAFPAMHIQGAEREAEVPADIVEGFPAMEVEAAEIDTSVGDKQVHQQPHKVPTSEDVKVPSLEDPLIPSPEDRERYRVICKTMLNLLEDWNKKEIQGVGRKARPPMETSINLVGDEGDKEANATAQKPDAEGKGCRLKRLAKTLLSPFTDPSRKKRPTTGFHAQTPEACFDPTQPAAMDDVKAMIQVCKAWKSDISADLELEPFVVGADFFYKLVDETAWMSSRHLDMAMFLIRKRQLSHPQVFGTEWTTAEFCLQVYLPYNVRQSHWVAVEIDFVRHTATVYDSYTVFTSNTMLVRQMEPITQTLAKVLYDMRFYEKSEVEAVKRKGIDMSTFNPFTICRISDVPQQSDGMCTSNFCTARVDSTSCGIMIVKFIEYLSVGIPFNTIDPAKFGYYRLKLAIEALRGEAYGIGDFNTVDGNVHVLQLASDLSMAYVLNSDCVSSKTCIMLFMKGGPSRFIPILTSQILYMYVTEVAGCFIVLSILKMNAMFCLTWHHF
ncbi:unnamed protein product [Prunus armeniaca]